MAATATISHSSLITLYSNSQLNTSSVLKNTFLSSTSLVYSSSSTISINSCNTKLCGAVTLKSRNGRGGIRGGRLVCLVASSSSAPSVNLPKALMFDCDGVLVDTEKDGHRISFNDTFAEKELGVTWDVDLYGELLKIGGGKERMTAYFNKVGWPEKAPKSEEERKEFIASLHKRKTELFMALIEKKMLPLRPGVAKLIDQALDNGVKVAVCSTSNEKAAIYLLASSTLGVDPSSCVVIEDSAIGLAAAKAAGMKCIVTKSGYTAEEDFLNADAVFDCIGDPPEERFDLSFCGSLLEKQYVS
ncbi:CBBY-like protein isoform X2 [Coffea eugenioides]|uniref:CBBY-like protein isoform X2 n=1 Tax=Coffea eugenioides TaxID=49369 RepID=UPI000F60A1D7|nr:CBBY-like protein isoform X2 [Coffea eugenioides]